MPKIKGWRKGKTTSMTQYYVNTFTEHNKFKNRIHISISRRVLKTGIKDWVVFIVKKDGTAVQKVFKTKNAAQKYVTNYMKKHPNG